MNEKETGDDGPFLKIFIENFTLKSPIIVLTLSGIGINLVLYFRL